MAKKLKKGPLTKGPFFSSEFDHPAQVLSEYLGRKGTFERLLPPWKHPFNSCFFETTFLDPFCLIQKQTKGPFSFYERTCKITPTEKGCLLEDQISFSTRFFHEWHGFLEKILKWQHETIRRDLSFEARYRPPKKMRVLVSGSSGLVGRALTSFLKNLGWDVVCLKRGRGESKEGVVFWDPLGKMDHLEDFEGFDGIVHLAGKNIASSFWTKKVREELVSSRVCGTKALASVIQKLKNPPKVFICASAVGYYGDCRGKVVTEEEGPRSGFLATLAKNWEEAAQIAQDPKTRVIQSRFGMILAREGGSLAKMLPLFRWGCGICVKGKEQYFPWISLEDVVYALCYLLFLASLEAKGPFNFTAPTLPTSCEFAKELKGAIGGGYWELTPSLVDRFLPMMGRELLLPSIGAHPKKLLDVGYEFVNPSLKALFSRLFV